MKKIIFTVVALTLISTVAFGSKATSYISDMISDDVSVEEVRKTGESNFKRNERGFKKIIENVDRNKPMKHHEYEKLLSYSVFLAENEFTTEQLDYLNELLDAGYSEGVIQEVYEFWLTTDEDFSMIGDLCALSNEMYGIYWVENAFNKLTNNSHGVLDRDDIEEYYKQGLTYEDIYAANILSRRKGQTIQGILDEMLAGKEFTDIMVEMGKAPKSRSIKNEIDNVNSVDALMIAENAELNLNDIPEGADITEYINEIRDKKQRENTKFVKEELLRLGITKEEIDVEERIQQDMEHRRIAEENAFDELLISSFRRRGYTYEQIRRASELYSTEGIDPLEAVKIIEKEDK